jgi:hypothetical protein
MDKTTLPWFLSRTCACQPASLVDEDGGDSPRSILRLGLEFVGRLNSVSTSPVLLHVINTEIEILAHLGPTWSLQSAAACFTPNQTFGRPFWDERKHWINATNGTLYPSYAQLFVSRACARTMALTGTVGFSHQSLKVAQTRLLYSSQLS